MKMEDSEMAGMRGSKRQSGGHDSQVATDWSKVDWKGARKRVMNLRRRIYRATEQQDWHKVIYLTRKMLRSYSNLLVSVRKVTQVNEGKSTAGIDGHTATTSSQRGELVDELRSHKVWTTKPVKRVYIPKPRKKEKRPLGIPTIKDRVIQAVVLNACEPRFEAEFEAESYGFRPGRSCQDAIDEIYIALSTNACGGKQYIVEADIEGAFDNVSHQFILDRIGKMPGKGLIRQWLKAGYLENGQLQQVDTGTPQGGVISPLLANIALDGLRRHLGKGYRYARYADDFVVMTKTKEEAEGALPKIRQWLKTRGLRLKEEKTRIVHKSEGFNFLGFNIRDYHGKLLIKPQKEKVLGLLKRSKEWLSNNKTAKAEVVIRHLNPILRGWANYYRGAVSNKTFRYIQKRMWEMYLRWALKRHPNKGKRWVVNKYFAKRSKRNWIPCAKVQDRRGKSRHLYLYDIKSTPIIRHIKVKGKASPDDLNLIGYWKERQTRVGKINLGRGGNLYRVAEGQRWHCPICSDHLWNGESLDTHHITPVRTGGNDKVENLIWLHEACHYNAGSKMSIGQLA